MCACAECMNIRVCVCLSSHTNLSSVPEYPRVLMSLKSGLCFFFSFLVFVV